MAPDTVPSGQDLCLGHLSFLDSTLPTLAEDWQCSKRQVASLDLHSHAGRDTAPVLKEETTPGGELKSQSLFAIEL